jgi:predicted RNA binding protein YcfA (HicA-like mRNA interferase family)
LPIEQIAGLLRVGRRQSIQKIGYEVDHQTGSHIIPRHSNRRRLVIPDHHEGTLRSIIREAGITKDEFAQLL